MHGLKVENYILHKETAKDSSPGKQPLRSLCLKEAREEPGYTGVLAEKIKLTVKDEKITANHTHTHKNPRHFKLMNLALFYHLRRCKRWAH